MNVEAIVQAASAWRPAAGVFIVGVTGSVASGKSTMAAALAAAYAHLPVAPVVEVIATDGFLWPNVVLAERGLDARKGFPESYDPAALRAALSALRRGPSVIPAYSHVTYDVDPAAARTLTPPDILLVEGLALGLDRLAGEPPLLDCLIYLDAAESDLETWFVLRFMGFWEAAEHDETSFYHRFRSLDRAGAENMARMVWTHINLANLRQHIAPIRALADLVVSKGPDHTVTAISIQTRAA